MSKKEYIPSITMSIQAHPDDQEFTIAGTLAKWARQGCQVISVIVTSGDAGSNDPSKGADYKSSLGLLREDEQIAANLVLGIQETAFLHYPDGELEATLQLRKDLTRLIRQYKPELVITGDPTRLFHGSGYINHPDHRAAAEAAVYATFPSAGARLIFTDLLEEGYEPHNVRKLYLHGAKKPDVWVDTSETLELKIAALKKHASQLGDWDPTDMLRQWAADTGKKKGLKAAEAFKVMTLVEDKPES
ncbi:MAG: PIG-L deacetylase family protein [Anaerolineales bacterium]|jgi:LmbE family N-acetylglucosaminyl deacetylase